MKVYNEDKEIQFIPVNIKLETPEEVEHMKFIFNMCQNVSLTESMEASGFGILAKQEVVTFDNNMHKSLGNV